MRRSRWLAFVVVVSVLFSVVAPGVPGGTWGAAHAAPTDFELTNEGGLAFADEYQRLGGLDALGYAASNRFQLPDGFTYQLAQGALLQWWPDRRRVMLANSFEMLELAGVDDWLYAFKNVPRPIKDDGSGGDWNKAKAVRLGWLTNEAIKAKYLANPNPRVIASWSLEHSIELYGLPMSRPEKQGPFIVQRFQRIAFQLWVESVPGMPPVGIVVRVLGGELLKEAKLVPQQALIPMVSPNPTSTPAATPTAKPTPPPSTGALPLADTVVCYYGNRAAASLGVLGEFSLPELEAKLRSRAAQYDALNGNKGTKICFDYIYIVANGSAHPYAHYTPRMDLFEEALAYAERNNILFFIDLQLGYRDIETEMNKVLPYLKKPNVHIALDTEFYMPHKGGIPGDTLGSMDAADINLAARIMQQYITENNLPSKILKVYQFDTRMISNKHLINLDLPNVYILINADGVGFGGVAGKLGDYEQYAGEAHNGLGIKLFFDWDARLLSPDELMALDPPPDEIVYQ